MKKTLGLLTHQTRTKDPAGATAEESKRNKMSQFNHRHIIYACILKFRLKA